MNNKQINKNQNKSKLTCLQLDEVSSLKNEILTAKCSGLIGALLSESFSMSVPDVSISLKEKA